MKETKDALAKVNEEEFSRVLKLERGRLAEIVQSIWSFIRNREPKEYDDFAETRKQSFDIQITSILEEFDVSSRQHDVAQKIEGANEVDLPDLGDVAKNMMEVSTYVDRTSDKKKRRYFAYAIFNALDPDVYATGLTQQLLAVLDELSCLDILGLKDFDTSERLTLHHQHITSGRYPNLDLKTLENLVSHGLVEDLSNLPTGDRSPVVRLSRRGKTLVALLSEPGQKAPDKD